MSDRRLAILGSLLGLTLLVYAMVGVRVVYSGSPHYGALIWNLFLAWIPFVLALVVYDGFRRGASRTLLLAGGALWLLFFPNAPYLLTDFIHLGEGPAPLWYDALMLSAFAWTGLLLGFASLALVQAIVRRRFGPRAGWLSVLAALGLAGVGVYLGRFVRFNSWDALLHPIRVVDVLADQVADVPGRTAGGVVALVAFLLVGYLVVYGFTTLGLDRDE
jgi:uncharacterized membrane protein